MIIDIFKYFARFPSKRGLQAMATLGQSDFAQYTDLLQFLQQLPDQPVLPEIDHYVYAQSADELQTLLLKLSGTFLMVDYGEITFTQARARTLDATQRIAVTVARKVSDRTDALERLIINDTTLDLLSAIYRCLMMDADHDLLPWANRDHLVEAEFVPFVATELGATGWTMMLDVTATDPTSLRNASI